MAPVAPVATVPAAVVETIAVAPAVVETIAVAPVRAAVPMNVPRVRSRDDVDPRDRVRALIARYNAPQPTDPELERALEARRKELDERRKQQVQFEKDILLAEDTREIARVQAERKQAEDER